jgi:hypothetical protein
LEEECTSRATLRGASSVTSDAFNLIPGDVEYAAFDVYLRDRRPANGLTVLVSRVTHNPHCLVS